MSADSWIVGVILEDGSYETLTNSGSIKPTHIKEIVFPLSLPWIDEPVLYRRHLEEVASTSRNQGPQTTHSARVEGVVPNSNQIWEIEIDIWEYPRGAFNDSELRHSNQVRNAQWDSADLIDAMKNRF